MRTQSQPEIVAHRGDPVAEVENTLAAIHRAAADGARIVEIDVRPSRDGIPVLLHDAGTGRLWGRDLPAAHQSLAELRELRLTRPGSADPARIPTLTEALACASGVRLLIDLPGPEVVTASMAAVRAAREQGAPAPAWCGGLAALQSVREADPGAEIWMTWDDPQLPGPELLATISPQGLNPPHELVCEELRAWTRERGLLLSCWTVDDPTVAARVAAIGVDAITSNRAAEVRRSLATSARHDAAALAPALS